MRSGSPSLDMKTSRVATKAGSEAWTGYRQRFATERSPTKPARHKHLFVTLSRNGVKAQPYVG